MNSNDSLIELIESAKDACRFLDYFANNRTSFEGGGMPKIALHRLERAVLTIMNEFPMGDGSTRKDEEKKELDL